MMLLALFGVLFLASVTFSLNMDLLDINSLKKIDQPYESHLKNLIRNSPFESEIPSALLPDSLRRKARSPTELLNERASKLTNIKNVEELRPTTDERRALVEKADNLLRREDVRLNIRKLAKDPLVAASLRSILKDPQLGPNAKELAKQSLHHMSTDEKAELLKASMLIV